MPDSTGKLTDEEQQQALSWLNKKTKNHSCAVCNGKKWGIEPYLVSGNLYVGNGGLNIGGVQYPMAMVSCTNCGYVRHFMAVQMGIVSDGSDE